VPDLHRIGALVLRGALWLGAALVVAAGVFDAMGAHVVGRVVGHAGLGVLLGAPFLTLAVLAIAGRRTGTTGYAVASLVIALLGMLLAR
jgi:hypothetical protein